MITKENLILTVDSDKMNARLAISTSMEDDTLLITASDIEDYLKEKGIKTGVDKNAIINMVEFKEYNKSVLVASGKAPIEGKPGYYEYFVELEDAKAKPVINEDGTVDYYNSLKLAMVSEGQVIAKYTPATSGEYGFNVYAEMIKPRKGKEERVLRGKGIQFNEETREYIATVDGRIYTDGDKIIIDRIYIVNGDLDISKGNISFNGDVEVTGDVRGGLEIVTDGNVFIHGHVGGCKITAGGNITIQRGVQGRNKCLIKAGGDVAGSFLERCIVHAEGNIYADSMLDCEVYAKGKVVVNSKQGIVIGGIISGTMGVSVREAGNDSETQTILQSGVVKEILAKISQLVEQHHKLSMDVDMLTQYLAEYDSLDPSKLTPEIEETKTKLRRAKVIKDSEKNTMHDEIEKLNEYVNIAREKANVIVKEVVHPGVKINIGQFWHEVKQVYREVEYIVKNGKIVFNGMDE